MADEKKRLLVERTNRRARFKRDGFGKKSQLSASWRRPRGLHNKQRKHKKAKGPLPTPGYGSPVAVRSMHPSGYYEVLVSNIDDLEGIDTSQTAVRIAGSVGGRKRASIYEVSIERGIKVLNPPAQKEVKE